MVLTLVFNVYKVEQEMCRPFDISSCKKKARITTSFMFCMDFVSFLVSFLAMQIIDTSTIISKGNEHAIKQMCID